MIRKGHSQDRQSLVCFPIGDIGTHWGILGFSPVKENQTGKAMETGVIQPNIYPIIVASVFFSIIPI